MIHRPLFRFDLKFLSRSNMFRRIWNFYFIFCQIFEFCGYESWENDFIWKIVSNCVPTVHKIKPRLDSMSEKLCLKLAWYGNFYWRSFLIRWKLGFVLRFYGILILLSLTKILRPTEAASRIDWTTNIRKAAILDPQLHPSSLQQARPHVQKSKIYSITARAITK